MSRLRVSRRAGITASGAGQLAYVAYVTLIRENPLADFRLEGVSRSGPRQGSFRCSSRVTWFPRISRRSGGSWVCSLKTVVSAFSILLLHCCPAR